MGLKSVSVWAGLKRVPATIWARRAQSPHRSGVSARTKLNESPQETHMLSRADSSRDSPLVAFIHRSSTGHGMFLKHHFGTSPHPHHDKTTESKVPYRSLVAVGCWSVGLGPVITEATSGVIAASAQRAHTALPSVMTTTAVRSEHSSQVGSSSPCCSRLKRTSQPRILLALVDVQPTAARKNLTRRTSLTRVTKAHFRHNPWASETVIWAGLEHT
jgi:hypothetical protein